MDMGENRIRGEMQNMNWKMADGIRTAHGEMTESRGSVEAVWTAMETGKVEVTSDAPIVTSETCKLGQVETKSQEFGIVNEVDKLYEIKEEHTQVELEGDVEVERVECFETQCEGRINLPQGQGETVCSLVAGRDEVSPVRPYEVEWGMVRMSACQALGG